MKLTFQGHDLYKSHFVVILVPVSTDAGTALVVVYYTVTLSVEASPMGL